MERIFEHTLVQISERMASKLALAFVAGTLALAGGSAQAAVVGPLIGATPGDVSALVEPVQFRWGDRDYCWYPDGWRGPGWYWCGYAYRVGFGWGGPAGWNGWRFDRDDFRFRDRDDFRFRGHDRDDFRFRDHDHDRFRDHDRDHDRR